MKYFTAQVVYMLRQRGSRRNILLLVRFLTVLAILMAIYSVAFHYLMAYEGRHYSWITGLYWTLTVMSTLGFGDITFETDLGRVFSIIVLASGMIFLLTLLPFTFIQFFYAPWIAAQRASRIPREVPPETNGHVLLTSDDSVASALLRKLEQFNYDYVMITPQFDEASRLLDQGRRVIVGELDDPDVYRRARADVAAMVVTTRGDVLNTNVAFTVREVAAATPIVATANTAKSADILHRAGVTHALQLGEMMGKALSRGIVGGDAVTHVVGQIDELLIAEANAARTPLVGKTLRENRLSDIGVNVIGVWDRGEFTYATADTLIRPNSILVMTGTTEQLANYDEHFIIYNVSINPVVILGGGRVGRAASRMLSTRGVDWRIVELVSGRVPESDRTVIGDATDADVLKRAGLMEAPAVLVTTRDDSLNIYLTIYCRSLRPDIQIISRATEERNIATLHRAGADFVMSYASMGATTIFNYLKRSRLVSIAEGLDFFKIEVPKSLVGKTLADARIRERTGCTVVAIRDAKGIRPDLRPETVLEEGREMVIVGSIESEARFLERFVEA
ncbi:MAG: potassium channel protein [Phycisphaeraceae bacterium]|nr:potassium channel protein [Phycisphaeraceae bacterium]MCW5755298.1 potassium channel protein [Phycisphaeraceae bacterium]